MQKQGDHLDITFNEIEREAVFNAVLYEQLGSHKKFH